MYVIIRIYFDAILGEIYYFINMYVVESQLVMHKIGVYAKTTGNSSGMIFDSRACVRFILWDGIPAGGIHPGRGVVKMPS